MGKINDLTIIRIKEVMSVYDVVRDFCDLRKSGSELTCPCPIHGGKHLNHFKVNPRKNIFHCFVCGASGDAIDFLMKYQGMNYPDALRWLGQKYGIEVDEEQKSERFQKVIHSKPVRRDIQPDLPMLVLPFDMVAKRMDTSTDIFCCWLRSLPWDDNQRGRLDKVLRAYAVGHAKTGHTIFWQIDEQGRVRTGKMMRYLPDGHRDKVTPFSNTWIHSEISRHRMSHYFDPEKQKMKVCLFGLHLLNAQDVHPTTVNIVESEKTAIICATALGSRNGLWMATGGMQFLKRDTLQPLLDREMNIVLYPDHDGIEKWREKARAIGYERLQINDQYVNAYWREEDGLKADPADVILRLIDEGKRNGASYRLSELLKAHPTLQGFINRLDLHIQR